MSTENEATMTKPEILEVVKKMLADWQAAYDSKDAQKVYDLNCEVGFCLSLIFLADTHSCEKETLSELYKDVKTSRVYFPYWYEVFTNCLKFNCLLPRIDHLKRTIARLEKEIANETITP